MTEIFNRKELKERRTFLRNHATESERLLWERIRRKQVSGFRFRRQASVGGYVVDFYCPKIRLAIEIDGPSHDPRSAREYDLIREDLIKHLGISILRFRNQEVLENIEGVIERIMEAAKTFPLTKGEKKGVATRAV